MKDLMDAAQCCKGEILPGNIFEVAVRMTVKPLRILFRRGLAEVVQVARLAGDPDDQAARSRRQIAEVEAETGLELFSEGGSMTVEESGWVPDDRGGNVKWKMWVLSPSGSRTSWSVAHYYASCGPAGSRPHLRRLPDNHPHAPGRQMPSPR